MTETEENKIMWNALKDIITYSRSLEESKQTAQAAYDAVCPFLPLIKADTEKVIEEGVAA